jgi:hypothetical protein
VRPPCPNYLTKNPPYKQYMELHFVDMANVFVYCPYLKRARSAPAHYVRGNVAHPVGGISIVRLSCPCTSMLLPLKSYFAAVGQRSRGRAAAFSFAMVRIRVGSNTC